MYRVSAKKRKEEEEEEEVEAMTIPNRERKGNERRTMKQDDPTITNR